MADATPHSDEWPASHLNRLTPFAGSGGTASLLEPLYDCC